MRYALGMDIGGTSVRVSLVREDGEMPASASRPTGYDTPREEVLGRFADALRQVLAASPGVPVEGVGIGMPGFQDEHGRVVSASNLPALDGVDLPGEVTRMTGLPAAIENDMNMVALGEYHYGGHRVRGNLLVVAVGTGIGAAVVQDGELLRVARGTLGDPGHVLVENGGPLCHCGAHGCLEAHVAGWALVEQGVAADVPASEGAPRPADIFKAAREGHPGARALVECAAGWLGMGLASFGALYQPARLVLGGNVLSEGADLLLPLARETFRAIVQPWMRDIELAVSRIPQTAGVLGAGARILYHPHYPRHSVPAGVPGQADPPARQAHERLQS